MQKKYSFFVGFFLLALGAGAQLTVTNNNKAAQLAQIISGAGVTISNVTTTCNSDVDGSASGSFTCNNCTIGIDSGIILTTGLAKRAQGPNDSFAVTYSWTTAGDTDLANLTGFPASELFDGCSLEFDIKVLSDSVQFQYVFGSEEYPDFVCSVYNDAFGFFISGPGIVGKQNMALVPGTTVPVSINTINGGPGSSSSGNCPPVTYPNYFINNGIFQDMFGADSMAAPYDSLPKYIQYNGYTTILTASYGGLQPCQTYHLKLAIADVGDSFLDSGVFIAARSLASNVVTLDTPYTNKADIHSAVRGCLDGIIALRFQKPVTSSTVVHYKIGGSAVNGTDYNTINDSVTFNIGDTTKPLIIHPIGNSVVDSQTVKIFLFTKCDSVVPYDSVTLYIIDSLNLTITPHNSTICPGDAVQLLASGGVNFIWTPATGLSNDTIANPLASPAVTTTYTCSTSLGTCFSSDTARVTVSAIPFQVSAGPDDTTCPGKTVQLNATVTGTTVNGNPFVYSWSPTTNLSNPNINNPIASPNAPVTYVIQVSSGKCTATDSLMILMDGLQVTLSSTPPSCVGSINGTATANPVGIGTYTYQWSNGATTQTDTGLAAGVYSVVITANTGCIANDTVTVAAPPTLSGQFNKVNILCYGASDGAITIVPIGGKPPYTYLWNTGSTNQTIDSLPAGSYNCKITDSAGCSTPIYTALGQPTQLSDIHDSTQVKCLPPAPPSGTITVNTSGGVPPYSYSVTQDGVNWVYTTNSIIENLAAGKYIILISDSSGCTFTDSTWVLNAIPDSFSMHTDSTSCFGAQYQDGGISINDWAAHNEPYQYSIDNGPLQNSGIFANLSVGQHQVNAVNRFGCLTILDTVIYAPAQGYASIMPKDTTLKLGQSIQLSSMLVPYSPSAITSYEWTPSIGLSCADCPNPVATTYSNLNEYHLLITYNNICISGDSMTILVTNNLQVFIPSSFSPNNDGNNDVFEIYGGGIKDVVLRVFNRWGEKVFESTDQFNGWDGSYKGKLQDPGVFTYEAVIVFLDDKRIEKTGSLTLVR